MPNRNINDYLTAYADTRSVSDRSNLSEFISYDLSSNRSATDGHAHICSNITGSSVWNTETCPLAYHYSTTERIDYDTTLKTAIYGLVERAESENDHKEILTLIENTYNEALKTKGIHCEYIKIEVNEDEFLKVLEGDVQ